jgi:hypothetical protein
VRRSTRTSSTNSGPGSFSSPSPKKRPFRLAATACTALLLGLPAWTRPGPSYERELLDGGTFTLYQGGTRIGEEHFIIQSERTGTELVYRAGAELNLKLDNQTVRISVALEALGSKCRPRRYEAKINGGEATTIVGTLVRDRIRLDVQSPRGDEMREFLLRGRSAIVDKGIVHHHFFIWKLLEGNPSTTATVVVPRENRQHNVTIEDRGEEPVQIDGHELLLKHVAMIDESGATHHLWLDGDRVMQVHIPEEQFLAVRTASRAQ